MFSFMIRLLDNILKDISSFIGIFIFMIVIFSLSGRTYIIYRIIILINNI
jgi:hypothetical protein